jgi:hypothetical protein
MARRIKGLSDAMTFPGMAKVNPDARAAIKAARRGNCKTALSHLYDAAPHMQTRTPTEKHVQDFRTASIIVGKLCTADTKRTARYRSGAFSGTVGKISAERVHLNRGGYDSGGRYFGFGEKLYLVSDDNQMRYIRAKDAKTARLKFASGGGLGGARRRRRR